MLSQRLFDSFLGTEKLFAKPLASSRNGSILLQNSLSFRNHHPHPHLTTTFTYAYNIYFVSLQLCTSIIHYDTVSCTIHILSTGSRCVLDGFFTVQGLCPRARQSACSFSMLQMALQGTVSPSNISRRSAGALHKTPKKQSSHH